MFEFITWFIAGGLLIENSRLAYGIGYEFGFHITAYLLIMWLLFGLIVVRCRRRNDSPQLDPDTMTHNVEEHY
jgi:hypothetical protein